MNTKTLVTDGQLGQLAVRQNDLFRRVKSGSYASFDEVMKALQVVIEGKMPEPPTLGVEPKLIKWRTFVIGGVTKRTLLRRLKVRFDVTNSAEHLMKGPQFITQDVAEPIDTIILTPRDLGYTQMPTTNELLNPMRLREWSKQNVDRLPEGYYKVELLPAEAGPNIRYQYKDQPNGEGLWIAMENMTDLDGSTAIFKVDADSDASLELRAPVVSPYAIWGFDHRLVFRLRRTTKN